ncbi:MAG: hypothetical protein INQ03_10885 [Candidatus Heimdallarchaeota archaeon]|nr:hypothetical protein [Candidatus Heimdallarchaeota archaeon]
MDLLFELFTKVELIHGDFSCQNLLLRDGKLVIIDVRQAQLVNFKTYIDTPVRIRLDKSIKLLKSDIESFISFFERKYRINVDRECILNRFLEKVPGHLTKNFSTAHW